MYVIKISAGTPEALALCNKWDKWQKAFMGRRVSLDELGEQAQRLVRRK